MGTNFLLPFGTGTGANVATDATWLADASRITGFVNGIANAPELNKAWRQASIASALLGQMIVERTGLDAPDDGDLATLLLKWEEALAVIGNVSEYGVDTGAANALAVTINPGPIAYYAGLQIVVVPLNSNTLTAASINVNGLGSKNIFRRDGSALYAGDLQAGVPAPLVYVGGQFLLLTPGVGAVGSARFTSAATTNWTCPAGVFQVRARVWGAGGGGSGGGNAAGCAGGYSEGRYSVTPGTNYVVVVGAGGAGNSGTGTGGTGGTSSFSSFLTATGGAGGTSGPGSGGGGSGGTLLNITGGRGEDLESNNYYATGGMAPFGGIGYYQGALAPGGGGSATATSAVIGASGANGADGGVYLDW